MKSTKFIFLLILLFMLISIDAHAQFGFKGGINLPNVSVKNKYNNFKIEAENKLGFNAGVFLDIGYAGDIVLTSGLMYSKKQIEGNFGFVNPGTNSKASMSVDYLSYTITGKYNFLNKAELNPYLFFSPRISIYISDEYTQDSAQVPQSTRDIISDKLTKFGFGVTIGAGVDIDTETNVMPFVEVQFSPDFFNAYDDGYLSFKSNSIEALVGIRFK